jgi:hypothetical protein
MQTRSVTPERKPSHARNGEWVENEWFRTWLQFAREAALAPNLDSDTRAEPQRIPA